MTRKLIYFMTAVVLSLGYQTQAMAQNTLRVDEATAGQNATGQVVNVFLDDVEDIAGVQFVLRNPTGGIVTPTGAQLGARLKDQGGNPLNGFQVNFNAAADQIQVVLVSLDGDERTIPTGTEPILEILYDTGTGESADLTLEDVVLSGPNGTTPQQGIVLTNGKITLNTPPVLSNLEQVALDYTEDDGTVPVSQTIEVADADGEVAQVVVDMTGGNFVSTEDALELSGSLPASIDADQTPGKIILTGNLTGNVAPPADFQTALRLVTYTNSSQNPNTDPRTVIFSIDDGVGGLAPIPNVPGNSVQRTINVTALNDAPVLANIEQTPLAYTENDPAIQITNTITVSDDENPNMTGATVAIEGFDIDDVLGVSGTLPGNIQHQYSAQTGVLDLIGSASLADYQAALRQVTFHNTSDAPGSDPRTIVFSIDDGVSDNVLAPTPNISSNSVSRIINVTAVNDPPSLTINDPNPLAYTENDPATIITQTITVDDLDNTGTLASAKVQITQSYIEGEDILDVSTQPQNGVIYSFDSSTGTLTFTNTASLATYEAALNSVTYRNTSENPSTAPRTVTFTTDDGVPENTEAPIPNVPGNSVSRTINVTAKNDAPEVAVNNGLTVNEGSTGNIISNTALNEGDPDDDGADLTYTVATVPANGTLKNNGTNIAAGGNFTQDDINNDRITYDHDGSETTSDSFVFSLADGGENEATAVTNQTFNITITPVNDPPVITNTAQQVDAEEYQPFSLQILANDPDSELGFSFTIQDQGQPVQQSWLTLDENTGFLSGTPENGDDGTFTVTVTATEQQPQNPNTASYTFTLIVAQDVTDPQFVQQTTAPLAVDQTQATFAWEANEPVKGTVTATLFNETTGTRIQAVLANPASTTEFKTADQIAVTELTAGTDYTAIVKIADQRNNTTTSDPILFTTPSAPDNVAPTFKSGPSQAGQSDVSLTFKWIASEAATATITLTHAGGTALGTPITASTTALQVDGTLTVPGLTANTTYTGTITLSDGANTSEPVAIEGQTLSAPDNKSPVLATEPIERVGLTTANIIYDTNEEATTKIFYGTTTALGQTFTDGSFAVSHNARITGLSAGTKYFYRISGKDRSDNEMTLSDLFDFTTNAQADGTPPVFETGPAIVSITNVAAVFNWTNNEVASFALTVTEKNSPTSQTVVSASDLKLGRTVTVSGLDGNTEYNYSLVVTDGVGNAATARTGSFRTRQAADTTPPRLIGVLKATPDQTTIRVNWTTNETSDSRGEIGLATDFTAGTNPSLNTVLDVVSDPAPTKEHNLTFTGLTGDTRYAIIIRSSDAAGNTVVTSTTIATLATPDDRAPVPTAITATPGLTRAQITWTTGEPANSRVLFSTIENHLDGTAANAQSFVLSALTKNHSVALTGLETNTKYYYKVRSRDAAGNRSDPVPTPAGTFTTRQEEPDLQINGAPIVFVVGTTATITWRTNEPSTSTVLYGVQATTSLLNEQAEDARLVRDHSVVLTDLTPGATYQWRVSSTNAAGTKTASRPRVGTALRTLAVSNITDTDAPLLTARVTVGYRANNVVIVKWSTDERSTSRVYYRLAGAENFQQANGEDNVTDHEVTIPGLDSGQQYEFVVESIDAAKNELRIPSGVAVTRLASGLFKITGFAQLALGSFTTSQGPDTQAPVILSGPIVTGTNTNQVTLSWTTDELSTSTVNFGTGGNTDQQVQDGTQVTNHTVTITGLSASTVYNYAISSTDPSNNTSASIQAVVQTAATADVTAPVISNISTSSTFVSAADGASATITWDTNESSDSRVEYGTTAALGQTKSVNESVTSHSVTITRLTPSTTYSYRVASTDGSGNGPSTSAIATFTTSGAVDTSPPVFSGINTNGTTHTKVAVTWNTNENASSILLVINAAGDTSRVESGTLTKTHSLSVTDANFISASTAYTVVVQGEDITGNLGASAGVSVTTSAGPDVVAPFAPTGLAATPGNEVVQLTWNAVSDAGLAGYNVFKDGSQVASNVTGTSFTVTGLTNGTAAALEVRAIDQAGNESFNNPSVSATPALTAAPSAPATLGTFEGGTEVTTVSLKPILVISNATPVSGRATPTYTFAVYSDAGLTNLVTSISGITEGSASNPTHWQVTDPTLTDGIVLLDATTYHWRARANDGVTDGPWSATKTFTTSASKPTAVELAGFTAETDRGIVDIRWQTYSNLGLRGFHVYRSVNPGGPFELISGDELIAADQEDYVFSDRDVTINATYYYQVQAINQDEAPQTFGPIVVKVSPPNTFTLGQNAPNPFNPTTQIRYELPVSGQVQLLVYNLLGQEVVTLVDERRQAGFHTVTWNGLNAASQSVASGVYFYRIVVNGDDNNTFSSSKKMLLLK